MKNKTFTVSPAINEAHYFFKSRNFDTLDRVFTFVKNKEKESFICKIIDNRDGSEVEL